LIVIRTPSGLSGDMFVSGLGALAAVQTEELQSKVGSIGVAGLRGSVALVAHSVAGIDGSRLQVTLPEENTNRSLRDIQSIIAASTMSFSAKKVAKATFDLLGSVEGRIHGIPPEDVTFHEVGALDSILDVCLTAILFDCLQPARLICSPLPVCDGAIRCAHGLMMSPAPAVQELLVGVPIYGVPPEGETVTPTAIALLKALNATFGYWPSIHLEKIVRVYGGKVFTSIPNGALFALGSEHTFGAFRGANSISDAGLFHSHSHSNHRHTP
jgi:uncharacterized protein (DUF111 family)